MATVVVTLTLSDSTVLGNFTSSPEDTTLSLALNYFAAATGYQTTLPDGSNNPESKGNYMIRKMKEYTENVITAYAANQAADAARQQVLDNAIEL